ncbi:MAG: Rrf2 family transcriptional regulator [Streptococcus lutetiensis]|uniref:Rrf2 family transcriptional regulator n=1 Tax=Streptococcus lutetiensis TaxID=150055 RepID=UPI0029078F45|nr:Rrf2 family transcriptional regulator [Streptococcus lutetiensis]MDU7909227.1 Rrf2 family transcriptional regulator [Streptococcus lutetiensis]
MLHPQEYSSLYVYHLRGAHLTKKPEELILWDIFQAVEDKNKPIFKASDDTNPNCLVGRVVNSVLQPHINKIQETFQASLKAVNLASLIEDMDQQLEKLDFKNLPEKP